VQTLGEPTSEVVAHENQFGSGPTIIGLVAFNEPDNLSDGLPNSVALAAKLATATLKSNPVTVMVRTPLPDNSDLGTILTELENSGAKLVVGIDDERNAVDIAKSMTNLQTPTISLTSFADLAIQLYGAGFVPNEEAVALVNELARRGTKEAVVVSTVGTDSQNFTKSVLSLAAAAGINVRPVDGSTDSQFAAGVTALANGGVAMNAIVFSTGPVRAASMLRLLKQDARFSKVNVVGNSGWAVGTIGNDLKGAWYTALAGTEMGEFAKKFAAANGAPGTLNAAMTYDLLVMAAALPQAIPEDPYRPEVLTAAQGFKGFTGSFRFGPTGQAVARTYEIRTVK
jgi:ABC-type branched-subunit amino acid transport system substrate-binding protein